MQMNGVCRGRSEPACDRERSSLSANTQPIPRFVWPNYFLFLFLNRPQSLVLALSALRLRTSIEYLRALAAVDEGSQNKRKAKEGCEGLIESTLGVGNNGVRHIYYV